MLKLILRIRSSDYVSYAEHFFGKNVKSIVIAVDVNDGVDGIKLSRDLSLIKTKINEIEGDTIYLDVYEKEPYPLKPGAYALGEKICTKKLTRAEASNPDVLLGVLEEMEQLIKEDEYVIKTVKLAFESMCVSGNKGASNSLS